MTGTPLWVASGVAVVGLAHVWLWRVWQPVDDAQHATVRGRRTPVARWARHVAARIDLRSRAGTARRALRSAASVLDPLQRRLARPERIACAVGGLVWGAALLPMFLRLSHDRADGFLANDWLPHLDAAADLTWWPPRVIAPHFAFHVGTRLLDALLPGTGVRTSAAIIGASAAALTGVVITRFLLRPLAGDRRRTPAAAALAGSLWLLFSELPQVLVFRADSLRFDRLNASFHQWGTPTNVLAEPLQLVWLVLVVRTFSRSEPGRTLRVLVAVLGVVTALTLPALTLAMPLGLVIWLLRRKSLARRGREAVALVWVPLGLTAVVQVAISAFWMPTDRRGGVALVWLGGLRHVDLWGPGLGVAVLPLLWVLAGRGKLRGDRELALVGWCLVVAMAALLTIAETGGRSTEGNIGRVAYSVAWIAYLYLARWMLDLATDWRSFRSWPLRQRMVAPLLVAYALVCLVGGAALYLEQVGLVTFTGTSI